MQQYILNNEFRHTAYFQTPKMAFKSDFKPVLICGDFRREFLIMEK